MRRTNTQKGITLIALIITIVVLLILATVAISSITNDGILSYAQNAAKDYNQAVKNEQEMLDSYLGFLSSGEAATTFEEATKTAMLQKIVNSTVYDAYGNKIVVPAGFKIRVDNATNNADTVTEGIVIEDENGNQFVWIPVGKIYTDVAKTEANAKTITLGRYSSFTATDGGYTPTQTAEDYDLLIGIGGVDTYTEELTSTQGNAVAEDLKGYIESVTINGGYYLARYEAGVTGFDINNINVSNSKNEVNWTGYMPKGSTDLKLVFRAGEQVWNYVTQNKASELSKSMYNSKEFVSDLLNGYARDTAIVFIQMFGNKNNSNTYANTIGLSAISVNEPQRTGTNVLSETNLVDEQLNIYDLSGNCIEWLTETCSLSGYECTRSGGLYSNETYATKFRSTGSTIGANNFDCFRTIIYIK